jgi:hypothetical protein
VVAVFLVEEPAQSGDAASKLKPAIFKITGDRMQLRYTRCDLASPPLSRFFSSFVRSFSSERRGSTQVQGDQEAGQPGFGFVEGRNVRGLTQ